MTKYDYKYHLASQKWPNTNINRSPRNDWIRIYHSAKGRPFRSFLRLKRWSRVLWWPKVTTNANSLQFTWLTQCDSGTWGWITVRAHKVQGTVFFETPLTPLSTQKRTLTHSFFERMDCSNPQKSDKFLCAHLPTIGAHPPIKSINLPQNI